MERLYIIKIGGNIIDQPENLNSFLVDFSQIPEPKILVHGGGKIASEIAKSLGIQPQMVNGRRITDQEMLEVGRLKKLILDLSEILPL